MPTPDARFFGKPVFRVKTKAQQKFRVPDPPTKRSPLATHHKGALVSSRENLMLTRFFGGDTEALKAFNEDLHRCFQFLGQIGVGSFGVVSLVRSNIYLPPDPATSSGEVICGALYALKQAKNPSSQTLEEWRNAVALQQNGVHPNLIRYIRLFVPRTDTTYGEHHHPMAVAFLMEYVGDHSNPIPRDPSLATKLANEASIFPESGLWPLIRDLLQALNHIHSNGFIHMDVKPENIMYDLTVVNPATGQTNICLKVGDFGTMRHIDAKPGDIDEGDKKCVSQQSLALSYLVWLTFFFFFLGFTRYVAKELLHWTSAPTPKADMFSLGILILEMATNLDVPNGDAPYDLLRVPNLSAVPNFNSLSKRLQKLILSLLNADPNKRPSAASLLTGEEYPVRIISQYLISRKSDIITYTTLGVA